MDIQPVCSIRVLKHIGKDEEAEWATHFLSEGFAGKQQRLRRWTLYDSLSLPCAHISATNLPRDATIALEKMLVKTAGKYAFGDSITMADVFLMPQFYNGNR